MKLQFKFRTVHPHFTYSKELKFPWIWIPQNKNQKEDYELSNFIVFQKKPAYKNEYPWTLYILEKL